MAATFTPITQKEIEQLLGVGTGGEPAPGGLGFHRLHLEGTAEYVYGKKVRNDLTLRVYSSLTPIYGCRDKGQDAIRVVLFWRSPKGEIRKISADKRVHRTQNWQASLLKRINRWTEGLLGTCKCGAPLAKKVAKKTKKEFLSCCLWPNCPKEKSCPHGQK